MDLRIISVAQWGKQRTQDRKDGLNDLTKIVTQPDYDRSTVYIDRRKDCIMIEHTNDLPKYRCEYPDHGEMGPFLDAIEDEGPQDEDETPLPDRDNVETTNVGVSSNQRQQERNNRIGVFVEIPNEEIVKMPVADLRLQLEMRGQETKGLKKDLVKRLQEAMKNKLPISKIVQPKKKKKVDDLAGFKDGAYWKLLTPNEVPVLEPANPTFKNRRAPTIPERAPTYSKPTGEISTQ